MRKFLIIAFLSVIFTFIPLSIFWIHHQFVTGLNSFLAILLTLCMLSIVFLIYRLIIKFFKKHIRFTPNILFTIGLLSYLLLFFATQIFYGNNAFDIHLYDTYYVMPYSFQFLFATLAFAVFTTTYYCFNKIFKKQMNYTLGYIHFWATFIGTCFLLFPMQYVGLGGNPRRYYDFSDSNTLSEISYQSAFISPLILFLIIAQLLFVFNLFYSIFKKTK